MVVVDAIEQRPLQFCIDFMYTTSGYRAYLTEKGIEAGSQEDPAIAMKEEFRQANEKYLKTVGEEDRVTDCGQIKVTSTRNVFSILLKIKQ